MIVRLISASVLSIALVASAVAPAMADSAKAGPGMTHIKTVSGLASTLEGRLVIMYSQGGGTSAVIGDSLAAATSQVVFHIPVTGTKAGVQHVGSMLVFLNTALNQQVQIQNPVVNLADGTVKAVVPLSSSTPITVFTISNAASVKTAVTTDRKAGLRTTTYTGAELVFAPGVGAVVNTALGLPTGIIADGAKFATADITLTKTIKRR